MRRLGAFIDSFAGCFGHRAQRDASRRYVEGLIGKSDRKSIQGVWGAVRDPGSYQALQHFITVSRWEAGRVWRTLREQIPERRGVFLVDDTGFPKQGKHSVGVQRQYSGTLGQVGNCQIAVSTVLRTKAATWPLALDLYLPESWANDSDRRESAAVPESIPFRTKWEIAVAQIAIARRSGIQVECVVADAGYGEITEFRDRIDRMRLRFVVGITSAISVFPGLPRLRRVPTKRDPRFKKYELMRGSVRPQSVLSLAKSLPKSAWKRVTWRRGTKGVLSADFAAIRVVPSHWWRDSRPRTKLSWLLCERLRDGSMKFHLSNLPERTSLKELVTLARTRWAVEQNYQQLKEELGLDHFEGRTWPGWHHHGVLTSIAFTFLLMERRRVSSTNLPTLPAMRRLVSEILFFHILEERPDLEGIWLARIAERRSRAPP